jgi:hypothetical protein
MLDTFHIKPLIKSNFLFAKSVKWHEPLFILQYVVYIMNETHFLGHSLFLKKVIGTYVSIIIRNELLAGFFFSAVGKVAVGGNARTRTLR